MRTLHFIYTVPRGTIVHRSLNKIASLSGFPPPYRSGSDSFIPWKHPIRAPHSISYHLLKALQKEYDVKFYSIYEHGVCDVKRGDIVLAQPAPELPQNPPERIDRESVTCRTFYEHPEALKIIIMPYSHDHLYTRWWSDLVKDHGRNCIFIAGKIWLDTWSSSPFRDFKIERLMRMDMGLDLKDYPRVKTRYNPPGERGFLYVGHTSWYKNTAELERIAAALPGYRYGHIGGGEIAGWKKIANFADLTPSFMRDIAEEYDIFVNTSSADPQVTTVLEHMAFGFMVAATPESGYSYPSLHALSTRDTDFNCRELKALQEKKETAIEKEVEENLSILRTSHSWERITDDVLRFIRSCT